jgi:hypothetical protein
MNNTNHPFQQKAGGIAALVHAAAYVVGLIIGVTLMFPLLDAEPAAYLAFLAENQTLVYVWNLIAYWVSAIALVLIVLALYERLKSGAPALMQAASVFGFIWAGLIIASGNLMLSNIGVTAGLYAQDSAQAVTVWSALQAVETGITSGNELVGSLWLLLTSIAILRTGALGKGLGYLGIVLSAAGIVTLVPSVALPMAMIFGLGLIVWCIWLGIVLLRHNQARGKVKTEPVAAAL